MLLTIILLFSFIAMLLELYRTNKYLTRFYAIVPLFFLFCAISFNRLSRDYASYQLMFTDIDYKNSLESGYSFLISQVAKFKGSHETIVFLAGCVFLFTLFRLMKNTSNINLVIFGYTGYSLVYDITQTRNFIMYLIVSASLVYIVEKKPLKYFLSLFLALQFHALALFYVPFYFSTRLKKKHFEKIIIIVVIIMTILSPILMKAFIMLMPDKATYADRTPGNGVFINYTFVILDVLTVYLVKKFSEKSISQEEEEQLSIYYRFVWLSLAIIPFSKYFLEIIRIQRNAQLIKYVFIAKSMKFLKIEEKILIISLISTSVFLSIWLLKVTNNGDLIEYVDYNVLTDKMRVWFSLNGIENLFR